jgi:hypothetical protein
VAYLAAAFVTKKNSFMILTHGVDVIQCFFIVAYDPDKEAGVLVPGKSFKPRLIILSKA